MGITQEFKRATKSAIRTSLGGRGISGTSKRSYRGLQGHPDDELLIAGTILRINEYTQNPSYASLTDGNNNTQQNRKKEIQASYRVLGHEERVPCLLKETDILNLLSTPKANQLQSHKIE